MSRNDERHETGGLSRRQMLYGLGAAGSAGILAGCGSGDGDGGDTTTTTTEGGGGDGGGGDGDDGGDTTTTTTETTREMSDQTFRASWARDAPLGETNISMFSPNEQHELTWPVMARMGKPLVATGEWVHVDVDGWEFDMDNNELLMTFKDGVKWHQGGEVIDDLTGEDYMVQQHMNRLLIQADPESSTGDNPSIVEFDHDGKTFVGHLNPDGVNQAVMESRFPRTSFGIYREYWREDYERLQDASTDDAMTEVRTDVIQTNMILGDDPPLSGPIMLDSVSAQAAEFSRFPEHWSYSDDGVNWESFRLVKLSASSGSDYQAGISDRIDYHFGIPDTVEQPPETVTQLFIESGAGFGDQISFNYGGEMDPWFGFDSATPPADSTAGKRQAKVRQAMAWAFDGAQIAQNNLGPYEARFVQPIEKPMLGSKGIFERRFPEMYESVPAMTASANPEKAKQALRESGLSEENGTWVKPDGSPLTVQIESFPWSRDMVETAVQNLKDVDVQAEHIVQEGSVLFSRLGGGEFAAAQSWTDPLAGPLASTALNFIRRGWPMTNQPDKWKVPPVGEYDAEPTETFDAKELAAPLQTSSFEDHEEELRKLHWIAAYHVPHVPLYPTPSSTGWNSRHFEFPKHPPRSSGENGRISAPGDGSAAAPVYGVGQPFRMVRRGLPQPNGPMARQ